MQMAVILTIGVVVIIAVVAAFIYFDKKGQLDEALTNLVHGNEETKKTLLIGLYHRFKKDDSTPETPFDFEKFVAKIMEAYRGGQADTTPLSGDYGVDIEHTINDKKYLGQVKCYEDGNNVSFEPIAIIHSQIIRQQAAGGFLVTTSDFTPNARNYAEGLNIELINGKELVDIWVGTLEREAQNASYTVARSGEERKISVNR